MKPLATLGDLVNWRAELRSEGVATRPPPASHSRPDRGYVEQPEERVTPLPRRAVIPIAALEREQLEGLAEELGEPSPFENTEPPPKEMETTTFKPAKPSGFASKPENETGESAEGRYKSKWSDEFKAAAVARVLSGERARRVAESIGVSEQNVSLWVQRAKQEAGAYQPATRRSRWDGAAVAARVLDGGEQQSAVAAEVGATKSMVSRWVQLERQKRELAKTQKKDPVHYKWKDKLKAVARVRELEAQHPGTRGHQSAAARELGIDDALVSNWCRSGDYEPEPAAAPQETKTMMSRPEQPQPMNQPPMSQPLPPAPVSYTQPVHAYQPAPHPPIAPPPWWNQQQPPPLPSAPAPSSPMVGLEEYIKRMVAHEMELQLPAAVNAALTKMWGQR